MKNKIPSIVSILTLTLLTVVMWIFLEVYNALKTTPELKIKKEVTQELNPDLDIKTIETIKLRYVQN